MEDQLIIELFMERSEDAIEELSNQYGRLLKNLSYQILRNEQDAEECVNDTYLAVWNRIPPERPDPLSSYICRIARNISINKLRSNTAKKRNSHYDLILDELEDSISGDTQIEDDMLVSEMTEYINRYLGKIKEVDRIIFINRYWFCKEIPEIAKDMGLSINYLNVHLHRTRQRLMKYLKKEGLIS